MAPRQNLQAKLEQILGNSHVYFQPPETVKLRYPCIIYERSQNKTEFANDNPYHYTKQYTVTVIDSNPDSVIPDAVASLPMCKHSRFFIADNLNHDVFNLYY